MIKLKEISNECWPQLLAPLSGSKFLNLKYL